MIKKTIIKFIYFYRNYLSSFKIQSCRYYPTCSQYTIDAVQKYGAINGLLKGAWRLLRCNPFSRGGYDPA